MNKQDKDLSSFDVNCLKIMSVFLDAEAKGIVVDDVVSNLATIKMEHYNLLQKNVLLENEVNIDSRTGAFKYDSSIFQKIITSSKQILKDFSEDLVLSCIRFSIDNIREVIEEIGLDEADEARILLCDTIRISSRATDYLIRLGDGIFDLILHSTDSDGAQSFVENFLNDLTDAEKKHSVNKLKMNVSASVSSVVIKHDDLMKMDTKDIDSLNMQLQKETDDALYEARTSEDVSFAVFDKDKKDQYPAMRRKYQSGS
jgi:diguanylate cyclase (GGDEF)-like protein